MTFHLSKQKSWVLPCGEHESSKAPEEGMFKNVPRSQRILVSRRTREWERGDRAGRGQGQQGDETRPSIHVGERMSKQSLSKDDRKCTTTKR